MQACDDRDRNLWAQAARGDRDAFAELARELEPRLRRFLLRVGGYADSVDDQVQEVFVRWIEGMDRAVEAANPRSWILGIAANVSREQRRNLGRREERLAAEPAQPEVDPARLLAESEGEERALSALRTLPQKMREVLVLSVHEGMSPREIARTLGLRDEAVRHRLMRARRAMEQILDWTPARREERA